MEDRQLERGRGRGGGREMEGRGVEGRERWVGWVSQGDEGGGGRKRERLRQPLEKK